MSLRKLLSLLLLTAFTMTSIAPAQAAVTLNSGVVLPTIAQDDGTRADGANRDVVPLVLRIGFVGGDLTFAPDGTALGATDSFIVQNNGKLLATGFTVPAPRVAVFVPPTGTEFVRLRANSYRDLTSAITLATGASGSETINGTTLLNVTADSATTASFPGTGAGAVVAATVLTEGADNTVFGTGSSTEFPAGSLVVQFFTKTDAPNQITTGAGGLIVINGIGLAADPGTSLGSTGDLNITYKAPNTSATALAAFGSSVLADETAIKVATKADNIGKLEFLQVGTTTGTEVSTTSEPDSQPNTILAGLISGTTVTVGPGLITSTGSSLSAANLDTDTLLIRATERTESTSSARAYYETPFNTSALVLSSTVKDNGSEAATLRDMTLAANTTNFPNVTNALITVTFALETPAGAASSATLAINAVTVSMIGPKAFNGYRNATTGGQTQSLETVRKGFLGSLINDFDNNTDATEFGVAAIYNGTASATQLTLQDTFTADYRVQNTQRGAASVAALNPNTVIAGNDTPSSTGTNAPSAAKVSIFPGSMVINGNIAANGTSLFDLVNTANGSGTTPFTLSLASSNRDYQNTSPLSNPSELSVRLVNGTSGAAIGNNAWFFGVGSVNTGDNSTAGSFQIGSSNFSASTMLYDNGGTLKTAVGLTTLAAANNAFMVAKLSGTTLQIIPLIDKFDGLRDVLAIRPEATITLDSTSKTTGVNLVATATGNNLPTAGVKLTIAKILPADGFTAGLDLTASALPVHGTIGTPALMSESSTDAGASRSAIQLSSVTGATTSTDSLSDIVGTGKSLDTTLPPLFCGGTVGTATRGPNGVVFQPKARAILLTENGTTNFQAIEDLGANNVIRITLPTGWDLNKYTATNGNFLATGVSGGLTATIVRTQNISSTISRAFIDITVDSSATTVSTKRLLGLFFKPNSLVVPEGVTSFAADVAIYNTAGTAVITDDTRAGVIGTVSLATACSTLLTVSFCDSSISSFVASGSTTQTTENGRVATSGSQLTEFGGSPSSIERLVNSSASNEVILPDLCVEEGVADALPVGAITDGVPSIFGESAASTTGDVEIHIASSFAGSTATGDVGLDTAATAVLFSDTSIVTDGASSVVTTGDDNEVIVPVKEGTVSGRKRPFEVKTQIRISGLRLDQAAASQPVTAQDLFVWAEVPTGTGSVAVGSNAVIGNEETNTTTHEFFASNVFSSGDEDEKYSNFFSDRVIDTTSGTVVATSFGDNSATVATNTLQVAQSLGNHATLTGAVESLLDNSGYTLLDEDTTFTVELSDITGSTDKRATVSVNPGSLEPGTLVTLASSGSGNSDSVTVPVLDDGSFIGSIRANANQSIVVTQAPTSTQTGALQLRELNVVEQNVEPVITAASAADIGIGTLTKRGTAPVVFTVTAKGKLDGVDFTPTASQLLLGTSSVTAVTGTDDKFIGIADFSKSTGLTVKATANGEVSTATITDLDTSNPTLSGGPVLKSVKVNKNGKLVLNGLRLRNGGTFGFVLNDGTYVPVDLKTQTANQKKTGKRSSIDDTSIPSNAVLGVFHVPGRGVSTIEL